MRMRLRAPDEPEAESSYDGDRAPSTPERGHALPPLDVGSPEYIEERLENLKRRPNWGDFLDQYVEDHPDSDSECDSEFDGLESVSRDDAPGFVRSTLWSLLVVALAPLLVVLSPCLRHKGYGFWPLGCSSLKELLGCALANVIFVVLGLVLLYWTICRELPDVFNVDNTLVKLNVQMDEVQRAADTCHAALLQWERTVAQELCMPVGIDVALLLLNTWLLLHYHRRWARYLMVLMAVLFVLDMPDKLYDATFPAPEILKVDPTFAMVDEELLVALDGKNLKPGGNIAWVAYWGCATTSNVDACEKQFVSTFEAGNVAVTFKSLDHFIPCYRDPPNPLKAQEYQCFESVRIRVKDKQSIPGWSRSATLASSSSPAHVERSLEEGLQVPTFRNEEESLSYRITSEIVKSTRRMARSTESIETVEVDVSTTIVPVDSISADSNGRSDTVEPSIKEGAQENDSFSRSADEADPEASELGKSEGDKKLEEVEVTLGAEVKFRSVNADTEMLSQSEDTSDKTLTEDSLQEQITDSEDDVKVEMTAATIFEDEEQTMDEKKVESDIPAIDDHELKQNPVIHEEIELSAMAAVVQDEELDNAPLFGSQEEKLEIQEEDFKMPEMGEDRQRKTQTNNYEAASAAAQEKKQEAQDFMPESSAPEDSMTPTQEMPSTQFSTPTDATQPAGTTKKRKSSTKRKSKRGRKAKKSLEADTKTTRVDTAGSTAAAV
ncbi:hypothetical protein PR003_g1611 [Phytophthora rubi]|uniref:Uncharacterized protein n=1 Tax=Phytophthora rubi TaxID=129364 RepID=A0A6A3P8E6_9STRA|nr:hypothetical protein PR002_g1502 [Phytophthora rubi]KAE9051881.1 hypothetical protein PR001_g1032 [Phytophthora rubi]KAE9357795.1 hypothetical protein PR003_g1611 [Phytophthora rubi]